MRELIQQITDAPEAIRTEAFGILREETEGAASDIAAAYSAHSRTGTLARRVKTSYPSSTVLVGIAQSTAPHSHLYEFGTQTRQTNSGANRGVMPRVTPAVVVPIVRTRRARMYRRMSAMLERMGFQVSDV